MIGTLVVLGASGDLTGRLLLPAVAALRADGRLPAGFRLVGADRFEPVSDGVDESRRADVTHAADVAAVLDAAGPGPLAVYLALPTHLMAAAVAAVGAHGLPAGSRIAVEKPFGTDAAGAAALNRALADIDPDPYATYRVDHALAMPAVQRMPHAVHGTGRPVDRSSRSVAQVDLLWEETLALEGRASFYDRAGALRDVVQNHLVQVLCAIAQGTDGDDAATRRADVLRAVRPLDAAAVRTGSRRGRYLAGRLADGRPVPDYVAEDGVDPARDTETFAEFVLELDSPQWAGTRFVLRAGKALDARRRGVLLHPHASAGPGDAPVWLDLDERGSADDPEPERAAYRSIVADLLGGGSAYSVGAAEAELAWQVVTPVLDGWARGDVPMLTYPAGSSGP